MARPEGRSDAYLDAKEAALSWLNANWEPALTVRSWWARLADPGWALPHLASAQTRAVRAAGGTDEIQRGIVGERVLGLPKEPRTDRDVPFRDLTIGTRRE